MQRCDVITINCPLHPGTEGLFNRELIRWALRAPLLPPSQARLTGRARPPPPCMALVATVQAQSGCSLAQAVEPRGQAGMQAPGLQLFPSGSNGWDGRGRPCCCRRQHPPYRVTGQAVGPWCLCRLFRRPCRRMCSKMKPGSYLVNTARGKICDRDAVVEALRSGHLAGSCAGSAAASVFHLRWLAGRGCLLPGSSACNWLACEAREVRCQHRSCGPALQATLATSGSPSLRPRTTPGAPCPARA